ncbi:a/g-specific adenine DNA glycosylase (ec 3.2.2.-) (muty homolog)(mmyh)-related [Schistosoma mansoni]|uniref:a/g-specific adenine DNA glycosylase (ec 3.2.2.-) (muty homolog)(mmyh)-related n=1 Tax=Schistosoma mansoni TaxID=6183 RepID=UPI00022DC7DA|nr:a/g-specific adenine DNA glycosylase (ec 3.2.2.-) (muty homolog)(mmyh)-related [Schistosoma mansoni]|eukprot:XP_018649534.1 a/g-specific adenine DNA glycosylase (ec 3.2.2.-) (muty homolog)(mmyh)-related [Schistosoma mansoni]
MCSIHSFTSNQIEKLRESLLLWYDRSKRDLPWRRMALNPDPNLRGYAGMFDHSLDFVFHILYMCSVWVSEVMLQQTQVKTVIDYYDRWMKKWPSVDQLASASLDDVNSLWSGLGYYSRARLLHKGAQKIVDEFNGIFPQSAEVLKHSIPGVGRYTAGAIASIAFNQCTPVLDGNVIRVLTRLRQIGSPVQLPTTMEYLWNLTTKLVDPNRPGDFNQALMELGAVCCTPKNPDCIKCPLNKANVNKNDYISTDLEDCRLCISSSVYQKSLGVMNYPVKLNKREPRKQNTVILITHTSRKENEALKHYYLLLQRPKTGMYSLNDTKFSFSSYIPHVILSCNVLVYNSLVYY